MSSELAPASSYEVDLAINQLEETKSKDLLLFDRNFPSYHFIATLTKKSRQFVIICSKKLVERLLKMFFRQKFLAQKLLPKNKISMLLLNLMAVTRQRGNAVWTH